MDPPEIFPTYTKKWHKKPYPAVSPLRPELSAKGKVVVITGGGTGIGLRIAKAFAQAGASWIGIVGRREHILISAIQEIAKYSTNGAKIEYAVAYVTKPAEINAAFTALAEKLGRVDVFVSNAGYLSEPTPLMEADDIEWWTSFEKNVKGTFHAVRAFLKHASPKPMLLSLNSGIAHIDPIPGYSAYAASKTAAMRVVDYFRAENPDLHTVCIQPGTTDAAMSRKSGWETLEWDHDDLPGHFLVWLASPEAQFLNGKFVWANWDVEELRERSWETKFSQNLQLGLTGLKPPGFSFETAKL